MYVRTIIQITCMASNGVSVVSVVYLVVVVVVVMVIVKIVVVFGIGVTVTHVTVLVLGSIGMGTRQELRIDVVRPLWE